MVDDGSGLVRRKQRRRTPAERVSSVAESYEAGVTVAMLSRKHGIVASQLSTWRTDAKRKTEAAHGPMFADLSLIPDASPTAFDGIEVVCGTVSVRLPKSTTPKRIADIARRLAYPS